VDGGFGDASIGSIRCTLTRANRQPAVVNHVRKPGHSAYRAMALDVLRIQNGMITEIIAFAPDVFESFGLPAVL
jgi:RNA polymerase sigma-70 factor (ECF subfamily)